MTDFLSKWLARLGSFTPAQLQSRTSYAIAVIGASGLFDAAWYLESYPDVAARGVDPLRHYVRHGAREGRDPNRLFSSNWYLGTYADVAEAGLNPLAHFITRGAAEGRN